MIAEAPTRRTRQFGGQRFLNGAFGREVCPEAGTELRVDILLVGANEVAAGVESGGEGVAGDARPAFSSAWASVDMGSPWGALLPGTRKNAAEAAYLRSVDEAARRVFGVVFGSRLPSEDRPRRIGHAQTGTFEVGIETGCPFGKPA